MRRYREKRVRDKPVLPPRLKDWKPGATQVGLFIRGPEGEVVEVSLHETPTHVLEPIRQALRAIIGIHAASNPKGSNRYERKDPCPS